MKKLCYGLFGLTLLSQGYAMDEGQEGDGQTSQQTQLVQQPQSEEVLGDHPATTNRLPVLPKFDIPADGDLDDLDAQISEVTTVTMQKDGTIVDIDDADAIAE